MNRLVNKSTRISQTPLAKADHYPHIAWILSLEKFGVCLITCSFYHPDPLRHLILVISGGANMRRFCIRIVMSKTSSSTCLGLCLVTSKAQVAVTDPTHCNSIASPVPSTLFVVCCTTPGLLLLIVPLLCSLLSWSLRFGTFFLPGTIQCNPVRTVPRLTQSFACCL